MDILSEINNLIENTEYEVTHISGKSKLKTKIPPEQRELSNLPRNTSGGKRKKAKVKFQDWLGLKTETGSIGKSSNGKYYGWSHRAIHGFYPKEIVKKGHIGRDPKRGDTYTIKDEKDAKEHAIRFAKEVG